MGIKTLRANEIIIAKLEFRRFRSKGNLLKKFRHFIENSTWDEDLLKYEKWINVFSFIVIAAAVLFFVPVALSVL
jgi:hypothetical protein